VAVSPDGIYQFGGGLAKQGIVFQHPDRAAALGNYYLPRDAIRETLDPPSLRFAHDLCENLQQVPHSNLILALPNDPAITGVPNESFTPPITLGQ